MWGLGFRVQGSGFRGVSGLAEVANNRRAPNLPTAALL